MALNYLLDSSTCIAYLRANARVRAALRRELVKCAVCAPVVDEVLRGELLIPDDGDRKRRVAETRLFLGLFKSLPFDDAAAEQSAKVYAEYSLTTGNRPTSDRWDLAIAGIARANKLTLVTMNTRHFVGFRRVKAVDWSKA